MEHSSEQTKLEIPQFVKQARGKNLELVASRDEATEGIKAKEAYLLKKQEQLDAQEQELIQAIRILKAGMGVMAQRALTIMALLASVGLFAWAVYDPQSSRITAASLFAVMVFLPALWADAKKAE